MTVPHSVVVDEVPYASPDDVLYYVRNRDEFTDPGREQVYSALLDRSDFVDARTRKAWRRSRVENSTKAEVKFSSTQKNPRQRRRARLRTSGRRRLSPQRQVEPWVDAQLTFHNVVEVEKLVVIRGRQTEDITDEGPEDMETPLPPENGSWWIKADRGRLQVDLRKFIRGQRSVSGRMVTDDVGLLVSYTYGFDESEQVNEGDEENDPSESVPGDLSDAVAKLVTADIMETDQYGSLFRESGGDVELTDSADALRVEAMDEISNYRREV